MEEKERYEVHIYDDVCVDLYDNGVLDKSVNDTHKLENLLNQQDKRIKELEQETYPAYKREHQRRAYLENIEVPKLKERIKELEEELRIIQYYKTETNKLDYELRKENEQLKIENGTLKEKISIQLQLNADNANFMENQRRENEQLKQELYESPKKIVDYFYDEIRHRAILEDDYCPDHNLERKYGVRKCLLEDIRATILKKFGKEDE